jgi:hypothetical protein
MASNPPAAADSILDGWVIKPQVDKARDAVLCTLHFGQVEAVEVILGGG